MLPSRPPNPSASSAAESGDNESRCVCKAAIKVAAGGASGERNGRDPRLPVLPPVGIPIRQKEKKVIYSFELNRIGPFKSNFLYSAGCRPDYQRKPTSGANCVLGSFQDANASLRTMRKPMSITLVYIFSKMNYSLPTFRGLCRIVVLLISYAFRIVAHSRLEVWHLIRPRLNLIRFK